MEELDRKKIKEIAKKHNLKLLLLFGSRVSGKTHKLSDYDFGFIGEKYLSIADRSRLNSELVKLVKNPAVEEVNLKEISPLMKYEVLKNNIILFEKSGAYSEYFARSIHDYFEARRLFNLQNELVNRKMEKIKSSL